jgi:hypothetical protein
MSQRRQNSSSHAAGTMAPISHRFHKIAERFYTQFKPKEALAELQKIIRLDARNFEALVKLARAHIDIGDQIPEEGPDSKDRKIKEYTVAEDFTRARRSKSIPAPRGGISG